MAEEKNTQENGEVYGKLLAEWKFPEFTKYHITKRWYLIMGIIAVALIIFSIFTQSYLLILIIALFVTIYVIRNRKEPNILDIMIFEDGIQIGDNTFYEWKDINKFWIIYEPPEVKSLYFNFKLGLKPSINISLEDQNPVEMRKILLQYIQEDIEKENESFSDGLSRLMKL